MKHIIMVLVLLIFSACSGDEPADDESEEPATSLEACLAKGANKQWDEAKKACLDKTAGSKGDTAENTGKTALILKEQCENKGPNFYWEAEPKVLLVSGQKHKQCKEVLKCEPPEGDSWEQRADYSLSFYHLPLLQPYGCMNLYDFDNITIINSTNNKIDIQVRTEGKKCIGYMLALVHDDTIHDRRRDAGALWRAICGLYKDRERCPSVTGVYEIFAGRSGFVIQAVNKSIKELKAKGCGTKRY